MKKSFFAKTALFVAAIIWGLSFFIVKDTVEIFPPNFLLAIRFTVGAALLALCFIKKLAIIDKGYLLSGAAMGACLFAAYCVQTIGITETTPGKNAFLTAIYCIIVPFLFWIWDKKAPEKYHFGAAIIAIIGIGIVSLTEQLTIGFGDALTLLGGFFYALHIVVTNKVGTNRDIIVLTVLQFAFAALFSWFCAIIFEQFPQNVSITTESVLGIGFLSVFATCLALLFQNVGQKFSDPSAAAIILSLESVFGVLFSVIFYNEQVTLRLLIGFTLIFVAVIASETKFAFLRKN